MLKCSLCGKEMKDKRAMHAHLLTTHSSEYRASGMKQSKFVVDSIDDPDEETTKKSKKSTRPAGFRQLRKTETAERYAIAAGYDFIDSEENIYTMEECKKKGWL